MEDAGLPTASFTKDVEHIAGNLKFRKVSFSKNVNYNSAKEDIEEDESGNDINGSKLTSFLLEKLEDEKIRLTITIYANSSNNNINYVDVLGLYLGNTWNDYVYSNNRIRKNYFRTVSANESYSQYLIRQRSRH